MRKAGLALQSPFRCVSGCFSSRSEFKSHLIPALLLLPAPAWLQSRAVPGWPLGEAQGGEGRLCPSSTCQPWELHPWELGGSGLQQPHCALGACPAMRLCLPRKVWWDKAVISGMLFLQPFCSTYHEAQPYRDKWSHL